MTDNIGPKEGCFEAETPEAERSANDLERPNESAFDGAAEASSRRVSNRDGPLIIRPFYRDGRLIMPAAWRDEDDEDDFYECEVESGAEGDGAKASRDL
jgi:hypothetical protein